MKDVFPLKVWVKNVGAHYTQQNMRIFLKVRKILRV